MQVRSVKEIKMSNNHQNAGQPIKQSQGQVDPSIKNSPSGSQSGLKDDKSSTVKKPDSQDHGLTAKDPGKQPEVASNGSKLAQDSSNGQKAVSDKAQDSNHKLSDKDSKKDSHART